MDVVFNHVNGATGSSFDVLMPGYYFRYVKDYVFSNGSGCGNETASEMPMYRKFIIDSVMFFAKEYKLGGFRFDLMAIHDLKTMNELAKELHDYDKNIVIYGEPWTGSGSALSQDKACNKENANKFKNDKEALNAYLNQRKELTAKWKEECKLPYNSEMDGVYSTLAKEIYEVLERFPKSFFKSINCFVTCTN